MLKSTDIVDLSQPLYSGREVNFPFELMLPDATDSMPMLTHDEDVWYKIGRVNMCTHNSTHVEVPYHHLRDGRDVLDFPLTRLVGPVTVLDFTHKKPHEMITLEELKACDFSISKGDILFIKTGQDKNFRSGQWLDFPYIEVDGLLWLIEKGILCLGTDASGIEDIYAHNQPGHVTLFKAGIPLVESLKALDQLRDGPYIVFILPLPFEHGDASPVRVTAIKKYALMEL